MTSITKKIKSPYEEKLKSVIPKLNRKKELSKESVTVDAFSPKIFVEEELAQKSTNREDMFVDENDIEEKIIEIE